MAAKLSTVRDPQGQPQTMVDMSGIDKGPFLPISLPGIPAEVSENINSNGEFTDAVKLTGPYAVQVTGSATAITVQLWRSTKTPLGVGAEPNWAPLYETGELISGNPSNGSLTAKGLTEPSSAWIRAEVVTISGGEALVSISGYGGV